VAKTRKKPTGMVMTIAQLKYAWKKLTGTKLEAAVGDDVDFTVVGAMLWSQFGYDRITTALADFDVTKYLIRTHGDANYDC